MRLLLLCASIAGCGTVESNRTDADADSDSDTDSDGDTDGDSDADTGTASESDTGSESETESDTVSETESESETEPGCVGQMGARCGDDGDCTAFDPTLACYLSDGPGGLCIPTKAAACTDSFDCLAASICRFPTLGPPDGRCFTVEQDEAICGCDVDGVFNCEG